MFIGELAALGAALGFSLASVCYTLAGRKLNAVTSMALSLPAAWALIVIVHQWRLGTPWPVDATLDHWLFLGASGVLAFVVSTYFMLNAYQYIGPRLTMLVASFAPALGALLAWIFLGQSLPSRAVMGIGVVIFGIVWVVAERGPNGRGRPDRALGRGITAACLGTLAQAVAFIFSSRGVAGGFAPFSATLIRISAGAIALWAFIAWQGQIKTTAAVFKQDGRLLLLLVAAALLGPVIAGSSLLLSFQYIPVGVATTLSHTTAIMLIPISYVVLQERITLRAVVGTLVTVAGIAILFR